MENNSYNKTTWVNEVTPLNEENMNKIEDELEKLNLMVESSPESSVDLSGYMTIENMENYVTYEVFRMAMDRIIELEKLVDLLPDYDSLPQIGLITPISENADGSYFIRWSASDPANRELSFSLKVGAAPGINPSILIVTNGQHEVSSEVFSISIPQNENVVAPTVEDIDDINALVGQVFEIAYTAGGGSGTIVKHEFSDDGKTYDITGSVLTAGDRYIYRTSYNSPTTINNAFITVYNSDKLKTKSNDFSIVVSNPQKDPTFAEFEIIPQDYATEEDTITIKYKTDKQLENVKISFDGEDYVSALSFNQSQAVFSVKNLDNGNYKTRLRGYYKEDA